MGILLRTVLSSSDNDLETFDYMEIGKKHRDSLNWEHRRIAVNSKGELKLSLLSRKGLQGHQILHRKKAS